MLAAKTNIPILEMGNLALHCRAWCLLCMTAVIVGYREFC